MSKVIVLGASSNPSRTSYLAVQKLKDAGHEVFPIGVNKGQIHGIEIINEQPLLEQIDTVTLYLNPERQAAYYDYLLSLKPKRIIFNPGTENPILVQLAQQNGIQVEVACTLVLLATHSY
ncbi:MAG: CoA-binding protein [Saprospiraceae bacterium]|nr:CoA-binding protein [Saprospiraceae bacterium]